MTMIKTQEEIKLIKEAGKILSKVLKNLALEVKLGVTPFDINLLCEKMLKDHGASSACLNYAGFPAHICISVNDAIVHGIPNLTPFKDGDLVSLDLVVKKNGYMADSAITIGVGNISENAKNILETTKKALYSAIYTVKDGSSLIDLAKAIKEVVKPFNYGILVEYCGHGIGARMHEQPYIVHDPDYAENVILKSGMVICIEPMITEGLPNVRTLEDGWTVVTKDGKISAHFEHTVLVTDTGFEILTE